MNVRKFSNARLSAIRGFYHRLFHGPASFAERLAGVRGMAGDDPAIAQFCRSSMRDGNVNYACRRSAATEHSDGPSSRPATAPDRDHRCGWRDAIAVADAVLAQNGQVVIFGLRGLCDAAAIERYRHQWVTLGKFGQLLRALNC